MKNPFTRYAEKLESAVLIKDAHKQKLAEKLFESKKKPFWTWTKAIFTAPVVATIAIIFFLSSNQQAVKQVLLPQEALAQALENTFNLSSSKTFFGLPSNDQLHHRKLISKYYFFEPFKSYGVGEVDFWVQGLNTRLDRRDYSSDDPADFNPWSELVNEQESVTCFTQKYQQPQCIPASKADQLEYTKAIQVVDLFLPAIKENFIDNIYFTKKDPEKIGMSYGDDVYGSSYGYVKFSTPAPIKEGRILYGSYLTQEPTSINFNEIGTNLNDEYINEFKDNQYIHQIKVELNGLMTDHFYFQIQELGLEEVNENPSMVYKINSKDGTFLPVVFDNFMAGIQKFILETERNSYFSAIPLNYIIENINSFTEPLEVNDIKYKNGFAKKFVYKLENKFVQESTLLKDNFEEESNYFMDILIDTEQMKFLGYVVRENDFELLSLKIEDEILPSEEAEKIFNKEKWLEEYLPYKWGIDY